MTPIINALSSAFRGGRNNNERVYLDALKYIMEEGQEVMDRTGVGTISAFGPQLVFDLREGFPALTTKRIPFKTICHELEWFLNGETNIRSLQEKGVHIWDEWADENGDLGPIYGSMWRAFPGDNGQVTDQIQEAFTQLFANPDSRRVVVSGWHAGLLPDVSLSFAQNIQQGKQALPPCHTLWQLKAVPITEKDKSAMLKNKEALQYVASRSRVANTPRGAKQLILRWPHIDYLPKYYLDMKLYQRSGDIFLGVPFNIASYSLLLNLFAASLNMMPRYFIHTFGDLHLYRNHVDQAKLQLTRKPLLAPKLVLPADESNYHANGKYNRNLLSVVGWTGAPPVLEEYEFHDAIPAPVAV